MKEPSAMRVLEDLPLDVLPFILSQLADRRDWYACALVSKTFNRVATPLLYRKLDCRVVSKTTLSHPSTTLLARPELAQYVQHVTETGAVHRVLFTRYPNITNDALHALSLCTNLRSLTWADDITYPTPVSPLLKLLSILPSLPVRDLTIRTHSDLGEQMWNKLTKLTGLRRISIWCMEGPPRVLQGWAEHLGATLTHLELGVSSFSLTPSLCMFTQLPLLQNLRLKGAPAAVIPNILAYLPNLRTLDTEYLPPSSSSTIRPPNVSHLPHPYPSLRKLTVRASSTDDMGPQMLFPWIHLLLPHASLESFTLHAFTSSNAGHTNIPRRFILDLARLHGDLMKEFLVGEAFMTLSDVECLCMMLRGLEHLSCATASPNVDSIVRAILSAKYLRNLKLEVQWIPKQGLDGQPIPESFTNWKRGIGDHNMYVVERETRYLPKTPSLFTADDAQKLMLRSDDSVLRAIGIGSMQYTGKWVLDNDNEGRNEPRFKVVEDMSRFKWY